MSTRPSKSQPRNVFGLDPRPNFHSNKQLVDLLSHKGQTTTGSSVYSASAKEVGRKAGGKSAHRAPNKARVELFGSQTIKKSGGKSRTNSSQETAKCCPLHGCSHKTHCRQFSESLAQYLRFQQIGELVRGLKTRARTDAYAFHKVFDVLARHCHHNRQLINDLRAI